MVEQAIIDRLENVITKGEHIRQGYSPGREGAYPNSVDNTRYFEWQAQSVTALNAIFGREHPLSTTFTTATTLKGSPLAVIGCVEQGLGVLKAAKSDVENGWTWTFQERVHEQVFDDFLEMATFLISDQGLKDPAAMIAGAVLEEHLRQLSLKHGLNISDKMSTMNEALKQKGVYPTSQWRIVQSWYDLRSDAAHGHFNKFTRVQVEHMIAGIRLFMSQHPA